MGVPSACCLPACLPPFLLVHLLPAAAACCWLQNSQLGWEWMARLVAAVVVVVVVVVGGKPTHKTMLRYAGAACTPAAAAAAAQTAASATRQRPYVIETMHSYTLPM